MGTFCPILSIALGIHTMQQPYALPSPFRPLQRGQVSWLGTEASIGPHSHFCIPFSAPPHCTFITPATASVLPVSCLPHCYYAKCQLWESTDLPVSTTLCTSTQHRAQDTGSIQ